jgi:hypothetical protein
MRRLSIISVAAIAASLAVAVAPAGAATPVREWVPIDETFTWDGCGFAVQEHDVLRLHFISWYDASGTRTAQVVVAPGARITYTNPATGASVTIANPFVVHKSANPDGSQTIAFTGLFFSLPGGGSRYVDSGRDLIVFSSGGVQPVSSVGPSDDLCAALAATIG